MKIKISIIIFILMLLTSNLLSFETKSFFSEQNILIINDIVIDEGQDFTLSIDISNSQSFVAFQMNLILPVGVSYVNNSGFLSDRAGDHSLSISETGSILTIIVFSMSMQEFNGSEGTVLSLDFFQDLAVGQYIVSAENVIIANNNSVNICDAVHNANLTVLSTTDIREEIVSGNVNIFHIYPNPFSSQTKIDFELITPAELFVEIYNIKGGLIKTLYSGNKSTGKHSLIWDGTDNKNKSLASGYYLCKIRTGNGTMIHKILLIK